MGHITITFLGDLMCQMQQIWAVKETGCGYGDIFESVKHIWADSDFVVANLETPVTGKGYRLAFEEMRFNAPVSFLSSVKEAGIDFVTTANNHILDRGARGLDSTLAQIANIGLETTGAYANRKESEEVFVKNIKGLKVALVACTYDTNSGRKADMLGESDLWKVDYVHHPTPFLGDWRFAIKRTIKGIVPYSFKEWLKKCNGVKWAVPQPDSFPASDFTKDGNLHFLHKICDKIAKAKSKADIVVALPHIGGQYNSEPGAWQLRVTDALIGAGADLVVSNHAHTPLKIEVRKGTLVSHALGNFCFTPRVGFYNDKCQPDYSIVLHCCIDVAKKKLCGWKYEIVKTVTREDGVSVVVPITDIDGADVETIIKRVGYEPASNHGIGIS